MYGEIRSLDACQDMFSVNYSKMQPCSMLTLPATGDGYWNVLLKDLVPSNSPVLVTMSPDINPAVSIPDSGTSSTLTQALNDPLQYSVTMVELRPGITDNDNFRPEDILRVVYRGTHDTDADCEYDGCGTIEALKLRVAHAGNYLIRIELTNLDSFRPFVSSVSFSIAFRSPAFVFFLVSERGVLFLLSIALAVIYEWRLCKVKDPDLRLFEQSAMRWLNIVLVLYFEPVGSLEYLAPSVFS